MIEKGAAPIFVINLDRSIERMANIRAQLDTQSLNYTRVSGVDGFELKIEEREEWCSQRPRDSRHEWLVGQIGCFSSHMIVWQQIAKSSAEWGVVLEDDVHIASDLRELTSDLSWIPSDADVLRLETTLQGVRLEKRRSTISPWRRVSRLRSESWGAGAYLLRRDIASWLVQSPPRFHHPTDYFLFDRSTSPVARALSVFQLHPAVAIQDKFLIEPSRHLGWQSLIETGRPKSKVRVGEGILRQIARACIGREIIPFLG